MCIYVSFKPKGRSAYHDINTILLANLLGNFLKTKMNIPIVLNYLNHWCLMWTLVHTALIDCKRIRKIRKHFIIEWSSQKLRNFVNFLSIGMSIPGLHRGNLYF